MSKPAAPTRMKGWQGLFPSFESVSDESERDLATLEPAWGKAAAFFRTGHRFGHKSGSMRCMSLVEVHRLLGVFRKRYEEGNTLSLLQAVSMCAEENLPLPQWLAEAFRTSMDGFLQPGKVHSLDDVFAAGNLPTKSAKKAAAARLDWQLGGKIWHDVWDVVLADETLISFDSAVSRTLAVQEYGVGKTKAKSLIGMIEKSQSEFLNKDASLSAFLTKRRKLMT
jgi:hypothetical protein